ncbi:MAG: F-type H+-transporting ATPase subunit delta [Gammaproteobacteria bacterium]|jgi:F-type H+-transporting ATPase subunit delta
MSDFETIARPYAKAIFELASEDGGLQAWLNRLTTSAAIADDTGMQAMFDTPSMLPTEHVELFLSVYAGINGTEKASAEFKNFISLLAENGRLSALSSIADAYEVLKQEADGRVEVLVTSAQPLTKKQNDDIAKSLAKKLGKEVTITSEVDEKLIAGAIVRAGDLVIDGSVLSRLGKLSTALNK